MATLPLWRKLTNIPNRHARFPDDFGIVSETIIDDWLQDHSRIGPPVRWFLRENPGVSRMSYAAHTGENNTGSICLHEVVWRLQNGVPPKGVQIDHANRNGLDNRLENLRLATKSQQSRNRDMQSNCRTGYKGVTKVTRGAADGGRRSCPRCWQAYIWTADKRKKSLGYYADRQEAAFAFNCAVGELQPDFGVLNTIPAGSITIDRMTEILRDVLCKIR